MTTTHPRLRVLDDRDQGELVRVDGRALQVAIMQRLAAVPGETGLTTEQLADRLTEAGFPVTLGALRGWLNGDVIPPGDVLLALLSSDVDGDHLVRRLLGATSRH